MANDDLNRALINKDAAWDRYLKIKDRVYIHKEDCWDAYKRAQAEKDEAERIYNYLYYRR